MSECRLDDNAVECSKTQGKERFSPDQQRLTFAGQQPELMKDNRCRRAPRFWQTGRSMYSAACHDMTVSSCSQVLMPKRTLMQLRDNQRGVARETRAQPFARISTQLQQRRVHRCHLRDRGESRCPSQKE